MAVLPRGELTFDFIRPPDRRISMRSILLDATDDVIVMALGFSPSKPLNYHGETVLDVGYRGISFLFKGRSFAVGRAYRPDGTWTGYYVDVIEPARWEGSNPNTLQPVIDLFLDLWITPDGGFMVLDEDEFEEAVILGHLTSEQVDHARSALHELVVATERGEFPPAAVRECSFLPEVTNSTLMEPADGNPTGHTG